MGVCLRFAHKISCAGLIVQTANTYTDGQKKRYNIIHKHELHELTVTRTLSKASGLFEFIDFC